MKKSIKALLISLLLLSCTTAFAASKKNIVCTSFPQYDWVMNILGENSKSFNVILLQDNGTDLHSYQPSIKDIAKISTSDLFIYVGGESEDWVEKILVSAKNKNLVAFNMMENLGSRVKEEEIVEGMEAEEEEAGTEDEEETEYDEHIWLSLDNAVILVNQLSKVITELDSSNAATYKENAQSYTKKLNKVNEQYKIAVNNSNKKTVLFGDRFPFRYLTDDYGLSYYAAFVGCSAESEASFKTIAFLASKVDELNLCAVLTLDGSDKKIAKTVISNTKNKNQQILEMDSLQSVTKQEIKNGRSYISAMTNNLEVLKKALQ